jgi:hypothetical protein
MKNLEHQMNELENKIDRLHGIVEEIGHQVCLLVADKEKSCRQQGEQFLTASESILPLSDSGGQFPSILDYKDSIVGGSEGKPSESSIEQSLTPETQIRRLTAQLTAAYNRIAALEEQLLAVRLRA